MTRYHRWCEAYASSENYVYILGRTNTLEIGPKNTAAQVKARMAIRYYAWTEEQYNE